MTYFTVLVSMLLITANVEATHLPLVETLECSQRNFYCEQTLGHDDPSLSPFNETIEPQYTSTGALKIDRKSFDALLKDYPDAKLRVLLVDERCLAQMEAAMRAMEPFTITWYLSDLPLAVGGGMRIQVLEENQEAGLKAVIRWLEVKRECWRQP